MKLGAPQKYTNEELLKKINEFFELTDNTPLYRYEQRKGNLIIPKNFEGNIEDVDKLIKIPLPKIYLEGALCVHLEFDKDWLTDTLNKAKKRIEERETKKSYTDKDAENDANLVRIISYAKNKCTIQKTLLAGAGLASVVLVNRLEGYTERTDITSEDKALNITNVTFAGLSSDEVDSLSDNE